MPRHAGRSDRVLTRPPHVVSMVQTKFIKPKPKAKALNLGVTSRNVRSLVVTSPMKKSKASPSMKVLQSPKVPRAGRAKPQRSLARTREVTEEAKRLAAGNKLTVLERRPVSKGIENQYAGYYQQFVNFCREGGLSLPPSDATDDNVTEFMDQMFSEGRSAAEGEKVLASVEYHHCKLKGRMTRSRKALRGWRKEMPAESRIPIPKLITYGMSMLMMSRGHREMAIKLI